MLIKINNIKKKRLNVLIKNKSKYIYIRNNNLNDRQQEG